VTGEELKPPVDIELCRILDTYPHLQFNIADEYYSDDDEDWDDEDWDDEDWDDED
jgi:hypothetical protein